MKLTKQLILLILSGIMLITVTALLIFMLRSDATAGDSTPSSTAGITSTTMPSTAVAAPSGTTAPPQRDNNTSNHCSGHGSAHNGTAGDHSSAHYHAAHYGATGDDSAHCAAGDHTATDSGFQ